MHGHLGEAKRIYKNLVKSVEKEKPLNQDRPQRLRTLGDTLGGPNLSALDTCFFQQDGDGLLKEVTHLARKICDVADMSEPLQSPNLAVELACVCVGGGGSPGTSPTSSNDTSTWTPT